MSALQTEVQEKLEQLVYAYNSKTGIVILGHYNSTAELPANPKGGDAYAVRDANWQVGDPEEDKYNIFIYDSKKREWVNHGKIKGAKGDTGAAGLTTSVNGIT